MNNCARYLVFFQYIGTKYSGAVKVPPHQLCKRGVQDHLEDAIRQLRPLNPVSLSVSSRTDAGVHALSNSAHFDLQRKNDKPPFTEDVLVEALNFHLKTEQIRNDLSLKNPTFLADQVAYVENRHSHFIRQALGGHLVLPRPKGESKSTVPYRTIFNWNRPPASTSLTRAYRVPDDFHARYRARSRTYVYRLALGIYHYSLLPITERNLCWNLRNTELDVGAMREAAALLVGIHDFSSFRAVNSDMAFKSPVKKLDVVDIQPRVSFIQPHFHREIPFLELTFKSRSFLYKQVRRMTGALVAVGQGRLSVPQLKEILEARDSQVYPQGLVAPAHGLFLTRVDYGEADLQTSPQTSEEQFISSGTSED